ncbi:MAG: cryptochrome/photolyase family protein [Planctomycetota bacterium]|nr:cryptochrome/photolyase family protein [Planctomycetota bacterium]
MALLVFPHQLYKQHPGLAYEPSQIVLIEDSLFFGDNRYPAKFHKQKLWLHRATMKRYESVLTPAGYKVQYLEYAPDSSLADQLRQVLKKKESKLIAVDPTDFMLEKRLRAASHNLDLHLELLPNPGFLNSSRENQSYRAGKKRWFMADFYKWQRQRLDILVEDGEPVGGQWSFDSENRKKVPKKLLPDLPENLALSRDEFDHEAIEYVEQRFADHPGSLERLYFPSSHQAAEAWLKHFLAHRFEMFGDYEDAILEGESWLWHSVLTPALNIGLLTPQQVVDATLDFEEKHEVPLNSLEGFIRQVIGWREFMRATYEDLGVPMRTTNHWSHHRQMPASFYDGSTGIDPIDDTIKRILDTGYCHHIERLMVLGGFMFLCEIDPDEIYRWFMEMFVDSYDWVMVPNVFAMSQHADGGAITTKPYFSGSSYIRKMSHYKQGEWCKVWDGLYWRWIWNHVDELAKNPRWAMMCSMAKKMDELKREDHLKQADAFLDNIR